VCAQAAPAEAATAAAPTQADEDREARFLFEAGRTAYDAGRYREALAHFQGAYDLSLRPQLLYNVGQAADRLRQDEVALDAFERYLSALPVADNRPAVEERIKVLRAVLAEEQAAANPAPTPVETALAAPALADGPARAPTDRDPARDDDDLLSKWWVWAAAGGVVVAVVAGVLIASSGGDEGRSVKGRLVQGSDGKVIVALEAR
jgi:tetratricopeptide (TPR) repeat protein